MTPARLLVLPFLASIFVLSSAPCARAEDKETEVKAADVPKAVVDAIAKKYPGSVVTHWAREEVAKKVSFEAKIEITTKDKDGKESVRHVESLVAEDGKILAEEEAIAAAALPEPVKKAIEASKYAKATVEKIERTIVGEKAEGTSYEVVFVLDGKKHEVAFDAAGTILEEEDVEEGEGKDGKDVKKDEPKAVPSKS